MTDFKQIGRAVRKFVATGSGLDGQDVVPGEQKAPRHKDPYASVLHVTTDQLSSYPAIRTTSEGSTTTMWYQTDMSIQWYRDGAEMRALRYKTWAHSEQGLGFTELGISVNDSLVHLRVVFPLGPVRHLSVILGDTYEERVQMDISVIWADTARVIWADLPVEQLDKEIVTDITGPETGPYLQVSHDGTILTDSLN